jgi:DNA-directed RNA polymerase sigma subunit (sigma70/sigma32)
LQDSIPDHTINSIESTCGVDDHEEDFLTMEDVIAQEMIRNMLGDYLSSTLNEQELTVTQVAFGLLEDDNNNTKSVGGVRAKKTTTRSLIEIGLICQLSVEDVLQILHKSIRKLQSSYRTLENSSR